MGYFDRNGGPEIPEKTPSRIKHITRDEKEFNHYIIYTPAGNISILADYYCVHRQEPQIFFYEFTEDKDKLVAAFSLNTIFGVSDIRNDRKRRPEYWSE